MRCLFFLLIFSFQCPPISTIRHSFPEEEKVQPINFAKGSWQHYLQQLPYRQGPVVDYRGKTVANQEKHFAVLDFDVGTKDLQQCADAIMRLRAEYLFAAGRKKEISFQFTNGTPYSFAQYCKGLRPHFTQNKLQWKTGAVSDSSANALRSYLDIVYTYAGTISLCSELKMAADFAVGVVIIKPGSPGHCMLIIDEAKDDKGNRYFRLAEGYTPAQSIYILRVPGEPILTPWYRLTKGAIETSSYFFSSYSLKRFE